MEEADESLIPKYNGEKPPNRLMTREEIKARFNLETASVYSRKDPVFLPDYAATFELMVDCVVSSVPRSAALLDLGAGTGNLTLRFLRRNAECFATLVDFSENMLNEVPVVLKEFKGRYRTICADFSTFDFEPGSFDAVISSFAIHHTRGIDAYLNLYRKIRSWLRPGGIFACVDVVDGNSPAWSELNENGWKKFLSPSFDAETIELLFKNYRIEDSPLSLPGHLDCLSRAGFSTADILWKRYNFALYCGKA